MRSGKGAETKEQKEEMMKHDVRSDNTGKGAREPGMNFAEENVNIVNIVSVVICMKGPSGVSRMRGIINIPSTKRVDQLGGQIGILRSTRKRGRGK